MAHGNLSGHVVVVTGAASGIGRACVFRFLQEGSTVVLVDRDAQALAAVAAEIGAPAQVQTLACDVSDSGAASLPPRACINELVVSPTWNRDYLGLHRTALTARP